MNRVDELYKNVRRNMKVIRKEKGITQRKLAELIGVSEGYVSDIERDSKDKHPSINCLFKISEALGVELIELLERREEV